MKQLYEIDGDRIGVCICPDCYSLDNRFTIASYKECRTCGSKKEQITVDEIIAPTIIELNRKGYETKACCSGHINSTKAHAGYIAFINPLEKIHRDSLPEFCWVFPNEHNAKKVFRWTIIDDGVSFKTLRNILDKNEQIYNWAKALPNLNEDEIEELTE